MKRNPRSTKSSFSEEMIQNCLKLILSGKAEEQFEIIPRIGVLRDLRFNRPLIDLLAQKDDIKRREFAAYAMGSIGNREFLEPLERAFLETRLMKGPGSKALQFAVVEAIGGLGDDTAAEFFLPVLSGEEASRELAKLRRFIVESLGAIAQQGGRKSLEVLLRLARHGETELRALALSEIAVAYWHRPDEVEDVTLKLLIELTRDRHSIVAESALAALQSLADVGCRRAEKFFAD